MKSFITVLILALACATVAAQEKGVDQQNSRIRDTGNNRQPGVNGEKKDVGTGRGIDWGRGKTKTAPPIPNPYRFEYPNDVLNKAVQELMRERKLILDDTVSHPERGVIVSQPYTFTRGSVVSTSELSRIADVPDSDTRTWTRGRYTILVEVQPIDGQSTNVSVNARVEGRSDDVTGAQWLSLTSNGTAEQEFLSALIEKVTGTPPPGHEPASQQDQ
ncbi:MAG TPA: hypothetical protein VFA21_20165 [Pyrinomonadaceae bacterium]|jgi:hypothetical protein|nr:hypothetical protein [Pyrinomonadaceae bacterium]